jgi:methyl-accepting chemotaxis protein
VGGVIVPGEPHQPIGPPEAHDAGDGTPTAIVPAGTVVSATVLADAAGRPVVVALPRGAGMLRWLPTVVILAGVVATVLGLIVVDQLGDRTRNIIEITVQGAEVVEAAADPIAGLPADVAALANGVGTALEQVREVAGTASDTGTALSVALGTNVASIATGTASVADRVADLLETIERFIPGDTESLGEELRQVADGLSPVAAQLGDLATQLDGAVDDLDVATSTIAALEAQLGIVADRLTEAGEAVQDLPDIATQVRQEAEDAREDLRTTLWLYRLLVVVTGLTVVAVGASLRILARLTVAQAATAPVVAAR